MAARAREKSWWGRLPEMLSRADIFGVLNGPDEDARTELAGRRDVAPEVLYFLASEGEVRARRAAASNPSTPAHANRRLAEDSDEQVRAELARKIGRILPNLSGEASEKVQALTLETLDLLARDQLPRVRQILSEEIKSLDCVPNHVVRRLARDVEKVSAPVLEFSPLLSDADLIDIITTAHANHALKAIARRRPLSENVSDAIAAALDVPAVAALLDNADARIREQTLEKIADKAEAVVEWHRPLVLRNDLSQRAIRRLAGFVSASLIEILAARNNLDEDTRRQLARAAQSRLAQAAEDDNAAAAATKVISEIEKRFKKGTLNDEFVERAAEAGRRDAVTLALALLATVPEDAAKRIMGTRSAKPLTALVWRAGLSMRTAFKIQTFVMRLPADELIPARDGIGFPMPESEMRWHLSYFGVRA
ncbi:MAG: DUF2336 domain-containing protein [Rhizomicrobium sp.]